MLYSLVTLHISFLTTLSLAALPQPGGLSVGLQATPAALPLGMLFLQVVRMLPASFHSVSTQMLSYRLLQHCPLFVTPYPLRCLLFLFRALIII